MRRWPKLDNCPGARPDGRYDVAVWREFANQRRGIDDDGGLSQAQLKARQILLQNQKLEFQLSVLRGENVSSDKVRQWAAQCSLNVKRVLLQGPASLAPQVIGVSIQEAETILKQWVNESLRKLSDNPLGEATFESAEQSSS